MIAPIRPPARLGPPTCAIHTVSCSFEFPSTRCSRSMSGREVRLVGDVEEDREDADQELQDQEVPDLEDTGAQRTGMQREEDRASAVADDQDLAAAKPVDPDARGQRKQDERQEAEHSEERERERACVQADGGEPRDRELGDLRAELADRLAGPELDEVRGATRGRRSGGAAYASGGLRGQRPAVRERRSPAGLVGRAEIFACSFFEAPLEPRRTSLSSGARRTRQRAGRGRSMLDLARGLSEGKRRRSPGRLAV